MSPLEDKDATRRIQKALLITEGPENLQQFFPSGTDNEPNGVFDQTMAREVVRFQVRVFPGQKARQHGQVDKATLDQLQAELRGRTDPPRDRPPLMPVSEEPKDTLVFITGAADLQQKGGAKKPASELGDEAMSFARVRRPGRSARFIGFAGSLVNSANVELALEAIEREYDPSSKLILYGYSAGAVQVMQICDRLDFRNVARNKDGKPPIIVNLLVTIDAAAKIGTPLVSRIVAGSVRKNANFFQTWGSELDPIHPVSHGGPNTASPSRLDGSTATIQNVDMSVEASNEAPKRFRSTHAVMQQIGHDKAMVVIQNEMSEVKTGEAPSTAKAALFRKVRL